MLETITGPWPWYISGPLLGLMVPLLLFFGNKQFGVSSSFRHICAAVMPKLSAEYFRYEWKKSLWSLVLVAGVVAGAVIATLFLGGDRAPELSDQAVSMFRNWGVGSVSRLQPEEIFSLDTMFRAPSLILLIGGGFLVGFGTRYANGCTSGHAIMGIALLSPGSIVATISFFAGGLVVSNFMIPAILSIGG